MIRFLQKEQTGVEPLPDNWQEIMGFASDSLVESCFATSCRDSSIIICGPCSSTFSVAWSLAEKKSLALWDSVLAFCQRQGRGQMGREWFSPPGNLYASLRLPIPPPEWNKLLFLLCGYCLKDALFRLGFSVVLKWPNDILLSGRKVAGLLLEERDGKILLGIGLNIASNPSAASLRPEQTILPTCLNTHSQQSFFALPLWSTLVSSFYFCYQNTILTLTPSVFLTHLQSTIAFSGELVTISSGREAVRGLFSGLTSEGGIILNVGNQKQVFFSGSLALAT